MASAFGRSSGSRALDLVNTLDWRDDPARQVELIPTVGALAAWSRHAGFSKAASRGIVREQQRARAISLRETLAQLVRAMVEREPAPTVAARRLAGWVREAWGRRDLTGRGCAMSWTWKKGTDPADQVLYELALEAAALLVSAERDRLRVCAGEGCGWFFLDRSKAGRRRWCNMAACGNRVKVRRYRKRVAHG